MTRAFRNPQLAQAFARMRTRRRTRPQPKAGVMNKAESQYAAYLSHCADVVSWKYEAIKLKLSNDCWFTPDFMVELDDGMIKLVDVKKVWRGKEKPHAEDDAVVKMRMVGEGYGQWFEIVMVWFHEGQWHEKQFDGGGVIDHEKGDL